MEVIEKRVPCEICLLSDTIVKADDIRAINVYYYNYLHKYNLLHICEKCFKYSYNLFLNDTDALLDWLDEHDNRAFEDETNEGILRLRESFDLSADLLINEPDQYLENLEKYVLTLENKIITESIKL